MFCVYVCTYVRACGEKKGAIIVWACALHTHARTHTFPLCTFLQDRENDIYSTIPTVWFFHFIALISILMLCVFCSFINGFFSSDIFFWVYISHRRNNILNKKSTDDWLIVGYDGKVISCCGRYAPVFLLDCFKSTLT